LVAVTSLCPNIVLDIRYATTNNFTGQQVYPSAKACLLIPTARKLAAAQAELEKQGLGLKVFDAYRPIAVQQRFWEIMPDERYVANPKKGSRHNRGSAVDVTLVRLDTKEELPMPTPYDDFSEKASYANTNLPPEVLANRQLLCDVMTRNGFLAFPTEWWHFDDADWEAYPLLNISIEELP
jgi:D-alanyl-D-alanine dipeptidase